MVRPVPEEGYHQDPLGPMSTSSRRGSTTATASTFGLFRLGRRRSELGQGRCCFGAEKEADNSGEKKLPAGTGSGKTPVKAGK